MRNAHTVQAILEQIAVLPGAPVASISQWTHEEEHAIRHELRQAERVGVVQSIIGNGRQRYWFITPKGIALLEQRKHQGKPPTSEDLFKAIVRRGYDPQDILGWMRRMIWWPVLEPVLMKSLMAGWRMSGHRFVLHPAWHAGYDEQHQESGIDVLLLGKFGDTPLAGTYWRELGVIIDLPWATDAWIAKKRAWLQEWNRKRQETAIVVITLSETRGRQWLRWMQEGEKRMPGGVGVLPVETTDLWPGGTLGIAQQKDRKEQYWIWEGKLGSWGTFWSASEPHGTVAPFRKVRSEAYAQWMNMPWSTMESWDEVLGRKRSKQLFEQIGLSHKAIQLLRMQSLVGFRDLPLLGSMMGTEGKLWYDYGKEIEPLVCEKEWTTLGRRTMDWLFPTFPLTEGRRSRSPDHDRELLLFLKWVQQWEGGNIEWYPFYQDQGISYIPEFKPIALRPDSIGVRWHQYQLERWYVEYDRGTERPVRWEEKLEKYLDVLTHQLSQSLYQQRVWCIVVQPGDGIRIWQVLEQQVQLLSKTTTIVLEWDHSTGKVYKVFIATYRSVLQGKEALWRDWLKNGNGTSFR